MNGWNNSAGISRNSRAITRTAAGSGADGDDDDHADRYCRHRCNLLFAIGLLPCRRQWNPAVYWSGCGVGACSRAGGNYPLRAAGQTISSLNRPKTSCDCWRRRSNRLRTNGRCWTTSCRAAGPDGSPAGGGRKRIGGWKNWCRWILSIPPPGKMPMKRQPGRAGRRGTPLGALGMARRPGKDRLATGFQAAASPSCGAAGRANTRHAGAVWPCWTTSWRSARREREMLHGRVPNSWPIAARK